MKMDPAEFSIKTNELAELELGSHPDIEIDSAIAFLLLKLKKHASITKISNALVIRDSNGLIIQAKNGQLVKIEG